MRKSLRVLSALLCVQLYAMSYVALASAAIAGERIVTLGGALTEIVYALDEQVQLVGVDQSSSYPAAALQLPQVGYYRNFSVEGVIGLKPTLILASDQAGPPESLANLQRMGLRVRVLPSAPTVDALAQRIRGIAEVLDKQRDGEQLIQRIRASLIAPQQKMPRTLMLMGRDSRLQGAGYDTAADAMLKLTGAMNVLAAQQGYKPIAPEALAALAPEAIVTTQMTVDSVGGIDKLLGLSGIAMTPAAKQGRIVVMDDLLLLGFGPRLPEALAQLRAGLVAPALTRQ
ncbi:MAG: ABC transporter substrate-binding protein [Spongiibacteraceae bacterium]